jgi:hypothetical protein
MFAFYDAHHGDTQTTHIILGMTVAVMIVFIVLRWVKLI